eukprot:jgi/Tetstr1/420995/TSEL_012055.t1
MADQVVAIVAAAAAAGHDVMEINVACVIHVELAKTKTRVPTQDIINSSRILGNRCEVAPNVSVSTVFADIGDFQSNLVACFHSNSKLPGVIMYYATGLRIAPNILITFRAPPSSSPNIRGVMAELNGLAGNKVSKSLDGLTMKEA